MGVPEPPREMDVENEGAVLPGPEVAALPGPEVAALPAPQMEDASDSDDTMDSGGYLSCVYTTPDAILDDDNRIEAGTISTWR